MLGPVRTKAIGDPQADDHQRQQESRIGQLKRECRQGAKRQKRDHKWHDKRGHKRQQRQAYQPEGQYERQQRSVQAAVVGPVVHRIEARDHAGHARARRPEGHQQRQDRGPAQFGAVRGHQCLDLA